MGNNLEEVQGTAASFFKWLLKTAWAIFWNSRNLLINQETESAAGKLKLSNGDDLFQLGKGCQERFSGDRKSLPDFHWPLRNAYCPYSRDFVDHSLPALTRKCWSSRENTVPLGPTHAPYSVLVWETLLGLRAMIGRPEPNEAAP